MSEIVLLERENTLPTLQQFVVKVEEFLRAHWSGIPDQATRDRLVAINVANTEMVSKFLFPLYQARLQGLIDRQVLVPQTPFPELFIPWKSVPTTESFRLCFLQYQQTLSSLIKTTCGVGLPFTIVYHPVHFPETKETAPMVPAAAASVPMSTDRFEYVPPAQQSVSLPSLRQAPMCPDGRECKRQGNAAHVKMFSH